MSIDLDELERLAAAATEGPWRSVMGGDQGPWEVFSGHDRHRGSVAGFDGLDGPDADFIAAARQAVPDLIAEVRRLRDLVAVREREIWDLKKRIWP